MKPFLTHRGQVFPLDRSNVDTDAILPKQYLKSISKSGYGKWLFDDWRYLDAGDVETELGTRRINPQFALNRKPYDGASILLARKNFGCGSSREHAVWSLRDYGFRVVIAQSFADIFYSNCFKNGVLPLTLPETVVSALLARAISEPELHLDIDLSRQLVSTDYRQWQFEIDVARRHHLLEGLDDIAVTLASSTKIRAFEKALRKSEPWLFPASEPTACGGAR